MRLWRAALILLPPLLRLESSCDAFSLASPIHRVSPTHTILPSVTLSAVKFDVVSSDLFSGALQPFADHSPLELLGIPHFDSTLYALIWAALGTAMVAIHATQFHHLPQSDYRPAAAWTRALIYFSGCNIFASTTGTTQVLLEQAPCWTTAQLADPMWQLGVTGCTLYILVAYWGLWSRMTLTFDRQWYLGSALVFGMLWGLSTGQLLLSFYHLFNGGGLVTLTGWAKYLAAYTCMGGWQYFIQDYWWDVYISPEHDTPKSIIVKTAVCHIPNVAICLAFLNQYDNYGLFVAWQTLALVAASIFQKFPAPWAQGKFDAPMTQPGVMGYPRGLGFIEEDLKLE